MPAACDDAKIRWEDGVPVSARFDDPFYSRADGLAESRHVFLAGNELANRFAVTRAFSIAELGFGTGLNFLAALALWRDAAPDGAHLQYTAFELYPMAREEIARALSLWPGISAIAEPILAEWPSRRIALPDATLEIVAGDARTSVPGWPGRADAWFLDGFAPARNPEMWEPALLATVHARTSAGGTFATYSAAGHVRRALAAAGFEVERRPGFGTKREMLTGRARPDPTERKEPTWRRPAS